jgi:hypothetical protein
MTKKGFKGTSSVTLRLFQGASGSQSTFEVVKVSGNPTSLPIDEFIQQEDERVDETPAEQLETFDGYFPEDGYDYTQHLRDINQTRFIPATRKLVDGQMVPANAEIAEVLAALDAEDCAEFDELDESFTSKLGPVDERTRIGLLWGEDQVEDYLAMPTDKLMAIQSRIKDREAASERKEISDEAFGEFLASEFDDARIGALTPEDVILEEDEFDDEDDVRDQEDPEVIRQECLEETKRLVAMNESLQQSVLDVEEDLSDIVVVPVSNVPEWDCESVLSTRSNLYNHPGLIARPKREPKKAAPEIATILEESVDETEAETPMKCVSTLRKKDETPEERKERKKAIKEFQREQRAARKTEEKQRREALNNQKKLVAIAKHNNYGDVPQGIPKFAI